MALFRKAKIFVTCIILWTFVNIASNSEATADPNIICFYGYSDDLQPEELNAFYCTHIITYGSIVNYTLTGNVTNYARIVALRDQNPSLKFLLSIGDISDIVHSPQLTESFISQSLQFLTDNKFDGLDIDWEFPAWDGDPLDSKDLFPVFLQKFVEAATALSNETGSPRMILSADVAAPLTIINVAYNITEMAKHVDFVNIMCYDFHFYIWYDELTGSNAALFNRSNEVSIWATMNTAWAANEWNERGMPKSKINVGIPTYGHTYNLSDPAKHDLEALATGPGMNDGWINYPQVCTFVTEGGQVVFDEESQVPYGYHDYDWISYDDVRSFTSKTRYILENDYAGTMVFSINSDDYAAVCDEETRFPLVATVYNVTTTYMNENKFK